MKRKFNKSGIIFFPGTEQEVHISVQHISRPVIRQAIINQINENEKLPFYAWLHVDGHNANVCYKRSKPMAIWQSVIMQSRRRLLGGYIFNYWRRGDSWPRDFSSNWAHD